MKKDKIIFITSVLTIFVCLSIVLGFTLAVFTDTTKISIGLQSGSIQMDAYITNLNLYSAKKHTGDLNENEEVLVDKNGDTYIYEKQADHFINGGTAQVKDKVFLFSNMSPGDRIDFDLELKNAGNIAIKYSALMSLVEQEENILFNAMDIKMETKDTNAILPPFRTGTSSLRTEWLSLGLEEEANIHISLVLPITADNQYQGIEAKMKCSLSAIQDLGDNSSIANLFDSDGNPVLENGSPVMVTSLKEAVEATPNGGTIDVIRGREDTTENENIIVNKSIIIQSADPEKKYFANVHFEVNSGAALEMRNIYLKGDSYIDISMAASLSIEDCVFDITPSRLFDESSREFLAYAAGIVSRGIQQSGIRLVCKNSIFSSSNENSTAFYLLSALTDDSSIENNTFGNTTFSYLQSPVMLSGAVSENNDFSRIHLNSNAFYLASTTSAVTLLKNRTSLYYLSSLNNMVIGGNKLVHMDDSFAVVVYDNGTKLQGTALSLNTLGAELTTLFKAINAEVNRDGKFTYGVFNLSSDLTEEAFREAFVYALALDHNISIID